MIELRKLAIFANVPLAGVIGAAMLGTTSLVSFTSTAVAQSSIDEVIVTARKRSESIQDVPVAVSALSPAQLEAGNIQTVADLKKLVPNVDLVHNDFIGGGLTASIRGITLDDIEKTFEPTVGMSVDGVFSGSNSGVDLDLFDLESVEVLRGPQGTLFGRNTIGGVINIKRTKPTGEYGMKVQLTAAENNKQDIKAVINAPLGDKGGIKVSLRDLESDSFQYNVTQGRTNENRDLQSASLSVLYNFTDNFTGQFTIDNYNDDGELNGLLAIGTSDNLLCALLGVCATTSADLSAQNDYGTVYNSNPFSSTIQGNNMTLNLEWDLGSHTLKSITGSQEFDEVMDIASWGHPGVVFPVVRDQEYEQKTQEFQLVSNDDGPLNYVIGLYMLDADYYMDSGPIQNFQSGGTTEAQAIFGELNYDLNDLWSVTAGMRYTEEEKTVDSDVFTSLANKIAGNPASEFVKKFEDDNLTYRLVLKRDTDFGMVYGSYSTGFRSGGFNARGLDDVSVGPYASEEVASLEFGLRSEFNDNALLNITAFITDYEDKQEQIVTAGTECGQAATVTCTFVRNAGQVEIEGLEIEGVYLATEALTLRTAIGLLDSTYDEFIYNGTDVSANAKLPFAPDMTLSLGFDYAKELSRGDLVINGTFKMVDDAYGRYDPSTYNFATGPDIQIDSYETLDLSATYTTETEGGQTLKVTLFGNDILEEGGRISRPFDAGAFAFASVVQRRQFGMTVGFEF